MQHHFTPDISFTSPKFIKGLLSQIYLGCKIDRPFTFVLNQSLTMLQGSKDNAQSPFPPPSVSITVEAAQEKWGHLWTLGLKMSSS